MPAGPATVADGAGPGAGTVSRRQGRRAVRGRGRWILVPASLAGSGPTAAVVAVVEPDADGLSCQRTRSSSGLPEYTLRLDQTPVAGMCWTAAAVADLYQLAVAGACAVADGALAAALELTTEHVRTREQFGRPLATFQAVAQQIADVYATARTLHLATMSACWQLDTGRDAARDTDVAAYWLAAARRRPRCAPAITCTAASAWT